MTASRLFTKGFSVRTLTQTSDKFIKFNTASGVDKMNYYRYSEQKSLQINVIHKKVTNGTYQFTPYKEKLILKNKNSFPRVISIPTIRDKIVLKTLHILLSDLFAVKQYLPQIYVHNIKNVLNDYTHFLKIDISNFFGSINHGLLIDILSKKIKKKEIISLIHKSLMTPNHPSKKSQFNFVGVPQGLPISNVLAHIYLNSLDEKFMAKSNIAYFRYVDDILILYNSNDKLNIEATVVEREIKYELTGLLNLPLNSAKEKKGLINNGFDFLGYKIKQLPDGTSGFSIKTRNIKNFENSIVRIFTEYKHSKNVSPKQFIFKLNIKITGSISTKIDGDDTREYKYGWLFYFSQLDDTGILYRLDWLVQKLLLDFGFAHIDKGEIKSFVKTFYEIRYNVKESEYIHRPDQLSVVEKRELLMDTFNVPFQFLVTSEQVEKQYYIWVYKPIKESEKDIQKIKS
jgi:RNA-directed DNA polymerase